VVPSQENFHDIRGLKYQVRTWGNPDAPKLFLLHGWMDVSASFQFLVDALKGDWHCIAPDWRGFGQSEWAGPYWFPDYLADLDAIVDIYSPEQPFHLLGHSMGGNVAGLYAGIRADRIHTHISLEGFGMPPMNSDKAPQNYRRWLDDIDKSVRLKPYEDLSALATRLASNNPRLGTDKAEFLAGHWGVEQDDGAILRADPAHKLRNPVLYRVEEAMACWREITAPTLWVLADQTQLHNWTVNEDFEARKNCFKDFRFATIDDCGHMLHHDQPEAVATLVETFIREHTKD